MSLSSTFRRSYLSRRKQRANQGYANRWLRFVLTAVLLDSSTTLQAQSTVGDWNLSSWAFFGNNISTPTVTSDGSTPRGLSATINSPVSFFLNGASDGMATLTTPFFVVPVAASSSYPLSQSFLLTAVVNFGNPTNQSQFVNPLTDNGIGIRIKSQEAEYISHYNLTISLSGGGVFSSVGGDYDGFGNLSGVGTSTVSLDWNPNASIDGEASFDRIQIAGGITGFSLMHNVTYFNSSSAALSPVNVVEIKINTANSIDSLPGDYNRNGKVDAADYVAWRKSPNNFDGDPEGYNTWRTNFGLTSGTGLAASENPIPIPIPVPEPVSLPLLTLAVPALLRRRKNSRI